MSDEYTWIAFEPQDVLFFRDARPFNAGEGTWARGIFPPTALPLLGALRNALWDNLAEAERQADHFGALRALGPFLVERTGDDATAYFATPAGLLEDEIKESAGGTPMGVRLVSRPLPDFSGWQRAREARASANGEAAWVWQADQKASPRSQPWMRAAALREYLAGRIPTLKGTDLWGEEPRTGVARKATKTAREGHLFSVGFVRLKAREPGALALVLGVRGLTPEVVGCLPDRNAPKRLRLGSEGRLARYYKLDALPYLEAALLPPALEGQRSLLLYLLTPGVMGEGSRPTCFSAGHHALKSGNRLHLRAVAADAPVPIGGWDLKARHPRPLHLAVPAGSVYALEADEALSAEDAKEVIARFHGQPLENVTWPNKLDPRLRELTRLAQAGQGTALVGLSSSASPT